uniref:glutamate--tRNA ligase n=3 Tax=Lotharella globosa TaxID=91324 RepID=A0A7S3ZGX6_9EUKA
MRYTVLSKRKLKAFVQEGTVEGWNDPRFPTVQGVIRRGLRVDALREFILEVGASVNDNMMSWDKVWAINKKKIDPVAHRFLAITRDSKVMMTITNFTEPAPVSAAGATTMDVQLHPKNKGIGMKKTAIGDKIWLEAEDASLFTEGEEVTLMRWGNCRITKITKDSEGKITELKGALNLMGDVKKTKYKVTWIADAADGSDAKRQPVSVTCVEFDHLITKPKLEDGDDYKNFVTGCSRFETHVQGEPALRNVRPGQLIQLERRGYFRCDKALEPGTDGTIVLFNIPTGKKKSMSSVGSKVAMKR